MTKALAIIMNANVVFREIVWIELKITALNDLRLRWVTS